jgi:hypothetical protein
MADSRNARGSNLDPWQAAVMSAGIADLQVDATIDNIVFLQQSKDLFADAIERLSPDHPVKKSTLGDIDALRRGDIGLVPIKGGDPAVTGLALGNGYVGINVGNILRLAKGPVTHAGSTWDYPAANPRKDAHPDRDDIALALGAETVGHETRHHSKLRGLKPLNGDDEFHSEYDAHGVGQAVHQQFGLRSGLNHEEDAETLRRRAALASTVQWEKSNPHLPRYRGPR